MIIDEDVYLEHHGVKGMRWGQKTKKQKFNTVGAGIAGALAGGLASTSVFGNSSRVTQNIGTVANVVGAIAGVKLINRHFAKNGDIKLSEIHDDKEIHKQIAEFLKKDPSEQIKK